MNLESREDIGNHVIHFTRGPALGSATFLEDALNIFEIIVSERTLRGGTGFIKGKYQCVCFTEAPVSKLAFIFSRMSKEKEGMRYAPYGYMFTKKWLFMKGGRPVIYGPEGDFKVLPEKHRYRHVRFSLDENHLVVDHTWEREWRIKTEELQFTPSDVTLVVPTRRALEAVRNIHGSEWHGIVLSDLGFEVADLEENVLNQVSEAKPLEV